ncbi:MBL fold metallo-hydrolase [Patescibacteria group bacterium]|nr:MBL fold metallo-hydrolase [Patescibacteria group bacterium]
MTKKTRNCIFFIFSGLIFINILAWIVVFDLNGPQFLEVTFFDVGQGDAIFIETPKFHQILIDGGPDSTILEKLGKTLPFYDRSLDLVILTHPEYDHMAGLIEVLKRYKVDFVLWTGVIRDTSEYEEWQKVIRKEGTVIKIAESGQKILWESNPKNFIDILYPFEDLAGQEIKRSNDTSIVSRLVFTNNTFLFTGDISKSVEKKMINREIDFNSNILKVAHHGSKTSTSEEFLKKVLPEIAVVQVGENKYGHPNSEVLEKLKFFDIKVLRTDLNGDIKIISDGIKFKYETAISNF